MDTSIYSYGLITVVCSMIIMSDLRKRVFNKEDILYRVKNKKKSKYLFYLLGLSIPAIILIAGVLLSYHIILKILIFIMSIEMAIIWTYIELGDTLITTKYAGKVWYAQFEKVESYQILPFKNEYYLALKRKESKKQDMVPINKEDIETVRNIMGKLDIPFKTV
ncbi:MAG: hypothetical protein BGO41_09935 [Clostridiales bacterium 38-18]|nr:MAG: hypothetical protein BGO41_09935 [Clostridiales bacterium 38-18]